MEEDLADQLEQHNLDDETQVPATHNKLLGAVSQLYEKKRVKAPTRKEPSLEVSEFHLSQPDKKQGRVKVTELARVLNKRAVHAEISHKLKTARKRAKTLPKPLEKFHADQITRAAGYEHAKRQLNRWDAVVYNNKVAEQLQFPLKNDTIKVYQGTSDVSKMFRKPTELEIKLAELLKEPDPTAPQKEEDGNKNEENEGEYPLTLAEIIEKRKMMAKLRAQQSYKQAKAARHSKIKSKKFHQIQRRTKVKEQLREFEELQKKDPEAALRKLEELERTRAEERVTLRHRSTGQWAKNLAVRAKYDKDARIALSEQLAKGRELTVKLAQDKDTDSEKEEEGEEANLNPPEEDPSNPWVVKRSKEMEDFVSGYRKFWETKGKEKENVQTLDSAVRVSDSQDDTEKSALEENSDGGRSESKLGKTMSKKIEYDEKKNSNSGFSNEKIASNKSVLKVEKSSINNGINKENNQSSSGSKFGDHKQAVSAKGNKSLEKNMFSVSDTCVSKHKGKHSSVNKANVSLSSNVGLFAVSNCCLKSVNKLDTNQTPPNFKITSVSVNKERITNSTKDNFKQSSISRLKLNSKTGSWTVTKVADTIKSKTPSKSDKLNKKAKNKQGKVISEPTPYGFEVSKNLVESKGNEDVALKGKSIDQLFEEVEDKLHDQIRERYEKLKESLNTKRKNEDDSGVESDTENIPSLELKKVKISADVDKELLEQITKTPDSSKDADHISKTLTTASSSEVKTTDDIDPNKFLKVTTRHLLSKLPDIVTEGEDALDDEETTAENRHLTISEAFAEDDVVDQFQKEKEEEAKKNIVGDVDLSLPGWGSWAGHNLNPMSRRKRKKFVIKFPKALPRRDTNRGNVIINEDADKPIKDHQVTDVPFPFTSVKEYEASIRAPLGATWVPQTAYVKLTAPSLITRMGAVIQPMDDSQLVNKEKDKTLPTNKAKKRKPNVKNKT